MKKSFKWLVLLLAATLITSAVPLVTLAEDDVDQYCDDDMISAATDSYSISEFDLAQTFTPKKSVLTRLGLAIEMGVDFSKSVTVEIRKVSDNSLAGSSSTTGTAQAVTWVMFTFDNLELGNTQYRMLVSTTSSSAKWVYSDQGCHPDGAANVNGVAQAALDFGFFTEAHGDFSVETPEETTVEDTEVVVDNSSVSDSSSIIAKALSLSAEYDSNKKVVKLNWAESTTTTIDGYRIYRSTDKNKGYSIVGTVEKGITKYSDDEGLEAGIYYYFVRAYDGNLTSANSNIASIEIPILEEEAMSEESNEDLAVSVEKKEPTLWQKSIGSYFWYVISGLIAMALGLSWLLYYLIRKRKIVT